MKFKRWTAEDTERLIAMVTAGQSASHAATALRRTVFFVRRKAIEKGYSFPAAVFKGKKSKAKAHAATVVNKDGKAQRD